MKKLIATILILLLTVGLCGCNGNNGRKNGGAATGSDLSWEEIEKIAEKELAEEAAASAEN